MSTTSPALQEIKSSTSCRDREVRREKLTTKHSILIVTLIALSAFTGCATQADFLNSRQDIAMQTAVNRARFDMNCPTANGQVLSRESHSAADSMTDGDW